MEWITLYAFLIYSTARVPIKSLDPHKNSTLYPFPVPTKSKAAIKVCKIHKTYSTYIMSKNASWFA